MKQVEVLVEDDRWQSINFEDLVTQAFYETLKRLGYSKTDYYISVLGCNDKKMRKLNLMFVVRTLPPTYYLGHQEVASCEAITLNRLTGLWMLNLEILLWLMKPVFEATQYDTVLHHMCSI